MPATKAPLHVELRRLNWAKAQRGNACGDHEHGSVGRVSLRGTWSLKANQKLRTCASFRHVWERNCHEVLSNPLTRHL